MAEIRRDPVSSRWVIIATERLARPHDFFSGRGEPKGGFCPFCEGNEDRTPPEIAAVRPLGTEPDSPGWTVRVVPNKFPALRPDERLQVQGHGPYHTVSGFGAHEVIIESPRHLVSPTEMAPEDMEAVIRMYCERARALSTDERLAYTMIFKNVGEDAGASIEHSHSQLIAVPVMPKRVHEEMSCCEQFYKDRSRCLFCDIMAQELASGERVVLVTDDFMVICPYAARFPFEMWVLPREHEPHFYEMDPARAAGLADALQEALARLEVCLQEPAYNHAVHTAPTTGQDSDHYHWHIEVIPRVTRMAGFEWGTGFYINPMAPESAAEHLRGVSQADMMETAAPRAAGTAAAQKNDEGLIKTVHEEQ